MLKSFPELHIIDGVVIEVPSLNLIGSGKHPLSQLEAY